MRGQVVRMFAAATVLSACGLSSDPSPTPPPLPSPALATPALDKASVAPSASASASPRDESLRLRWSEVPFEGSISALAGDGSRFVAVGQVSDHVAAWTSEDGLTWEEHEVPERSLGDTAGFELRAGMGPLIRLGDTLYSFGGMTFMDNVMLAGWRWTDGGAWEVIESTSDFFSGRITALAASDDALVAAKIGFGGLRGTYSTWRWTSGSGWVQTELSSTSEEDIVISGIAWAGGTYVAVGSSATAVGEDPPDLWPRAPAIWTSPDGVEWTAVAPPDGMSTACLVAPLAGSGFSVLGEAADRAAAWVLVDGTDWLEASVEAPHGPNIQQKHLRVIPCHAVAVADALLAMGVGEGTTLTWTSRDGVSWAFGERLHVWPPGAPAAVGDAVLLFGGPEPEASGPSGQILLRGTVER